jgi:hypothetical protein
LKIEVRNESNRTIYVLFCRTGLLGNYYLHVSLKDNLHGEAVKVKPHGYEVVSETVVEG